MGFALGAAAAAPVIKIGNPDNRLWRMERLGEEGAAALTCIHTVCPRNTSVTVQTAAGPAQRPDAAALKRIAAEQVAPSLPAEARAGITVTTLAGFPAIRARYTASAGGEAVPTALAVIYANGAAVTLRALSADPAYAPRAIDAVAGALTFAKAAQ